MFLKSSCAALALCVAVAAPASASVIVNVTEQGNDVVFSYSGSLDLNGTSRHDANASAVFNSAYSGNGSNYWAFLDGYDFSFLSASAINGQIFSADFGQINGVGSGDEFGIELGSGFAALAFDQDYVSGDSIIGSLTFQNQTLASMNLIDGGTLSLDWGYDSVNILVGSAVSVAAVPLPASLPLILGGLGALGIARRRKKA